jgi:hypothetical protein
MKNVADHVGPRAADACLECCKIGGLSTPRYAEGYENFLVHDERNFDSLRFLLNGVAKISGAYVKNSYTCGMGMGW